MPSIRAEWVGTLDGSLKSHGFNTYNYGLQELRSLFEVLCMITLLQCMLVWRNMYEIKLESEQLVLCGGKTENISFL